MCEYVKKVTKSVKKNGPKIEFSHAQRVLLVDGVTRTFLVHVGASEHQEEHLLQRELREWRKKVL
jgi:hypothetical protein